MENIRDIIGETLNGIGLNFRYKRQMAIMNWPQIAGREIAANSKIIEFKKDIVVINTKDSVWLHHLFMMKADFIKKINLYMGDNVVNDIYFKIGSIKSYSDEEVHEYHLGKKIRKIEKEDINRETINKITEKLPDDKLKKILNSIIAKNIAYNKIKEEEGWNTCKKCNTMCLPDKKYCVSCETAEENRIISDIIKILMQAPWEEYNEISKRIDCRIDEFIKAKQLMINKIADKIKSGKDEYNDKTAFAMLITGLSPLELTDTIVERQVLKLRGNKNVPASGSRYGNYDT